MIEFKLKLQLSQKFYSSGVHVFCLKRDASNKLQARHGCAEELRYKIFGRCKKSFTEEKEGLQWALLSFGR
jgi:hypothetical protein